VTKTTATNGRKSKGAQPGNTNAIKHGFYSRQFSRLELADLNVITSTLADEIALLKVTARRLFTFANGIDDQDHTLDSFIAVSGALGSIAIRIAHLTRTGKYLTGNESPLDDAFTMAIDTTVKLWRLDE
jgi:hypothetical protein